MKKECRPCGPWIPYLFIFIVATGMAWPLFSGKIIYLADGQYAFIKAVAMSESWRHGDFVGRWTPDVIHGCGYPFFNFYAPLFFYLSALLTLIGVSVFWAFNICIYLSLLATGMSIFAREIWGRQGGLLAAAAYLVAPYHIMDLYTRGALGEFMAFVFFPLVMRAVYRLMKEVRLSDILIGMSAMAALILSHNISALFFCAFGFAYFLYLFLTDPERSTPKLAASLSIFTGGVLLTTYFWLPALMEKKYVQIERLLTGIYDYHRNFLHLPQLIVPSWPKGPQNYYMIGPVHLMLALAVVVLWFIIARAIKGSGRQVFFFTMALIISVLLTLSISQPVWEHVPLLAFAEFPWRFLMCTTAAVSVLAGGFVFLFKEGFRGKVMWIICLVLILGSVASWHAFGYQSINYTTPQEYLRASLPMDNMEYLPKTVKQVVFFDPSLAKLTPVAGNAAITQTQGKYLDDNYEIHAQEAGILCYHTYNFPGWRVEINKQRVSLEDNPWGLIVFAVPSGDSQVRIYFTHTPLRQAAENISKIIFALFILCILFAITTSQVVKTNLRG